MKKLQKKFALILALVQMLCMMAGAAGAEYGAETGFRLGSVNLKDGIYYTVNNGSLEERQDQPESYLMYDQQRSLLTLKNFVYTIDDITEDSLTAALYIPADVTIELIGSNELTNKGYYIRTVADGEATVQEMVSNGINAEDHDILFTGDGSLKLQSCYGEEYKGFAIASEGKTTLNGFSLTLEVLGAEAAFESAPSFSDGTEADVTAGNENNAAPVNAQDQNAYTQNTYVKLTLRKSAELLAAEAEEAARQQAAEDTRKHHEQRSGELEPHFLVRLAQPKRPSYRFFTINFPMIIYLKIDKAKFFCHLEFIGS